MLKSRLIIHLIIGLSLSILLTYLVVSSVSGLKYNKYTANMSDKQIEETLNCLALNIYREAGNQSFKGKVAVAQVTLNRVDDGRFGNGVCGVISKKTKNPNTQKTVCQFSWYCNPKHRIIPANNKEYNESYQVAKMVLLSNHRLENINNALYYHATYVNPNWPYKRIAIIGSHIFYTD